jgi:formylglycine-generating enzyme required for sulfatase activity/dienelactone hydrolase
VIGTTVGHYRVLEHLGAGGMGTVYLAEDLNLKRRVALKFLSPERSHRPDAAARLLREARAASAVDHPNIATVYEIGEHDGQPFIAMAHYEGETLAHRLARGPLSNAEAARLLAQVAEALAAAHAHGVVHRDLKPANLMVTAAGDVRVLDFGLARVEIGETVTQLTEAGSLVGTAGYMSPEQATGAVADARSDLWSLGVITYEMLAGRTPFDGTHTLSIIQAVLTDPIVPIRGRRPDVAAELEDLVERTLVRDRTRRVITAQQFSQQAGACHARLSSGSMSVPASRTMSARRRLVAGVVAALLVGAVVFWWGQHAGRVRWARLQALPEIARLAGDDRFDEAYTLALQVERYLPDDPLLAEQMRAVSRRARIDSTPRGAAIFYRPYGQTTEPWRPLGETPLSDIRVPRGLMQWKAEKAGFAPAEDVGPGPYSEPHLQFALLRAAEVPPGMVRIVTSGQSANVLLPGFENIPPVPLPDFWIDRSEVTNRDFKRFVEDGGYRRPEFWREAFVERGRVLPFAAAMTRFRDATGRPGPAAWELGSYSEGQEDFPVGGVSWYEAAAYARWAGKSLPTLYHWSRAADPRLSGAVVPSSNFQGKSLHRVGQAGVTRGGTTDMAGNIKEWMLNAIGDRRYILGGGWDEPAYMFNNADAQDPFLRRAAYGFRCIKVDRAEDLGPGLTRAIEPQSRDPRRVTPVSDETFRAWRSLYSFDQGHLDTIVEGIDDSSSEWRRETVTFRAAYGDERMRAYLFLPRHSRPPYQVVVVFPGSRGFYERSSAETSDFDLYNFIMRSGRAMLYPVYKSTFERQDHVKDVAPTMSSDFRDHVLMWAKDVRRSVEYLESRGDISKDHIGLLGYSWGAENAPIVLAIEPRLSLGLIFLGAFSLQPSLPEVDAVNFAPRVTVPVLMLNGQYDYFGPRAISQEPLFRLLGTPTTDKRHVMYETSHTLPRNEMIKEAVNWMDRYWGPPLQ